MLEVLLNTNEAARFLGVSKYYLERDRWRGAEIPFVKIGNRIVRYRKGDLEDYILRRMRHSTSDRGRS